MSVNLSHRVRLRPPWPLRYLLQISSFNAKLTVFDALWRVSMSTSINCYRVSLFNPGKMECGFYNHRRPQRALGKQTLAEYAVKCEASAARRVVEGMEMTGNTRNAASIIRGGSVVEFQPMGFCALKG